MNFQFPAFKRAVKSAIDPAQRMRDDAGQAMLAGDHETSIRIFAAIYENDPSNLVAYGEYCRALVAAGRLNELVKLSSSVDFHIFDRMLPVYLHDLSPLERAIFSEVCLDVCQSPPAIASLSRCVSYISQNNIAGDLVECGVYKGASAVCMIRTIQTLGYRPRRLWLYDTFEGMPEPDENDVFYCESEGDQFKAWDERKRNDGSGGSDWVYSPLDEVKRKVGISKYDQSLLTFVKGKVEDTVPGTAPDQIALLRLDTDFYASTRHEMEHLYPRVVPGGIVIVDDYGAYRGSQKAVDEYFRDSNFSPMLARIDEHVRMFVKPSQPSASAA